MFDTFQNARIDECFENLEKHKDVINRLVEAFTAQRSRIDRLEKRIEELERLIKEQTNDRTENKP